nr:hypothetical protein GCM10010200_018740 [Actinomadura rugatobispora]
MPAPINANPVSAKVVPDRPGREAAAVGRGFEVGAESDTDGDRKRPIWPRDVTRELLELHETGFAIHILERRAFPPPNLVVK